MVTEWLGTRAGRLLIGSATITRLFAESTGGDDVFRGFRVGSGPSPEVSSDDAFTVSVPREARYTPPVPLVSHGRRELQLKGAGKTPYSRTADGRALQGTMASLLRGAGQNSKRNTGK